MQRMPRRAGIGIATDEELLQMSKERQRASFNETHGMFLPQRVCLLQPGVPIWEERERGYGPSIDPDMFLIGRESNLVGCTHGLLSSCLGHLKLSMTVNLDCIDSSGSSMLGARVLECSEIWSVAQKSLAFGHIRQN